MLLAATVSANAADKAGDILYQSFFNLTAEELRVDSVLPEFRKIVALPAGYQDSIYTVELVYPEFSAMTSTETQRCLEEQANEDFKESIRENLFPTIGGYSLLTGISQNITVSRKQSYLEVSFSPLAYKENVFRKLYSFMLRIRSKANTARKAPAAKAGIQKAGSTTTYAETSRLASGKWAKIAVASTGVHELTDAVIRAAGFTDLSKVKIYGYGGNLQSETIKEATLSELDDLQEVPSCYVGSRRLFFAKGPVHYNSISGTRVRNPYSDLGFYFITEDGGTPQTVSAETFSGSTILSYNDFHLLHENDEYAWYQGGRNLYEYSPIESGQQKTYSFNLSDFPTGTPLTARIAVAGGSSSSFDVLVNGAVASANNTFNLGKYDKGNGTTASVALSGSSATITIRVNSGGPLRLDYIDIFSKTARKNAPNLSAAAFPQATFVCSIANQNLHADRDYDMIIIVPTSQKFRSEADRLKTFHEQYDGLRVKVVAANELFNEFSSGTPDANAYRRYMKMLYDRAETAEKQPKYLLLFGAGAFDNRMKSSYWSGKSPDDYLLCFESENSFSETKSYANDGFYCLLDEGEGSKQTSTDREDVAVGRLPATSLNEARIMVDKIIAYVNNENAGAWQNIAVCMGDDGDSNKHMDDANAVATAMETANPAVQTRRIMWDTFPMVATSTGNSYPEVVSTISAQQAAGALIMDYSGHGAPYQLSHETVITMSMLRDSKTSGLPLWIAAACDVSPYDHNVEYLGKEAVINPKGGAIAFFSAARSVFPTENREINQRFVKYLLTPIDGKAMPLGEAQRLAKNEMRTTGNPENKLNFNLIGDPAMRLNLPLQKVVIDKINDIVLADHPDSIIQLKATSKVQLQGHIENGGNLNENFNGTVALTVKDAIQNIRCLLNNTSESDTAYIYKDRTSIIYKGITTVTNGQFTASFAVPKDIDYSGESGLITAFALANGTRETANGYCEQFEASDTEDSFDDNTGPSITCYINTPDFQNGGNVNSTPYFFAEINDNDGINTTGTGFGHDLELIVDGDMKKTYNLNDNFSFDFGSYTKGQTYYSLPTLDPGPHTLKFRAWDILNNSNSVTLSFNVVKGLTPDLNNIYCTNNPARESTKFVITHNFKASVVTAEVEVMNMAGRPLWRTTLNEVSDLNGTNVVEWNLTTNTGAKLQTGVYLYRVRLSADGSECVSKAKKLIILD